MLVSLAVLVGCAVSVRSADPVALPACGDTRYYVLLFGGQADWRPQTAHTWATFVRTTRHPTGITLVDGFTISWLPEQLPVRPLRLRPEPGRNYGLHETLDNMCGGRPHLSLWGPWEVTPEWYRQAADYKAYLDSGAVRYRVLVRLYRQANPILWFGELVTRRVANAMADSNLLVNPHVTHDWLIPALGIERYPLTQRRLDESGPRLLPGLGR
jgi:hypothetical protein